MNRRSFLGACAALLVLPAASLASRSVPRFIVDAGNGCRFHFTPFGEFDWIDMPSEIISLTDFGDGCLGIACVGGCYVLSGFPDPEVMSIREVTPKGWARKGNGKD